MANIGRWLVRVDLDGGPSVVLLAEDIVSDGVVIPPTDAMGGSPDGALESAPPASSGSQLCW
jgi:hypothetical protein